MRTTVDLTPEAYHLAKRIAQDKDQSLGKTISDLITASITHASETGGEGFTIQPNGLPLFRSSRPVTTDDVNYCKDEEWLYDDLSA